MIKNSKILLGVTFGILVLLIFIAVFLLNSLNSLAREKEEIRRSISSLDSDLQNLKVLENFLAETREERRIIEEGFVGEGDFVPFIENLEKAGADSSVEVRVESASLEGGAGRQEPSFRLTAEGDFPSLFRYMLMLENLPYEIAFGEVNLAKSSQDSSGANWAGTFIVKLKSYEN